MTEPASPPRRIRRWQVALAVVCLLVAVLWLLRGPLCGPLVASRLATMLSRTLGGPVTVQRAGGGWLHDAEITGVATAQDLPGTLRRVAVDHVAVRYDLNLLRGDLSALTAIAARGVRLEIVAHDDGSVAGGPWPAVVEWLPDPLPRFEISGGLSLAVGGERLDIPGFSLIGGGDRVVVAAQGLTIHDLPAQELALVLERHDHATLALVEPMTIAGVVVERLELTLGSTLQHVTIGATLCGGRAEATMTPTTASIAVRDLDLAALPAAFSEGVGEFWRPIAGRATVEMTAHRDAQAPGGWAVAATAHLAEGSVGGRTIRALQAAARLTAEGVRIDSLTVDVDGGMHIHVDDVDVAHLGGMWLPRRGRATVVVDDVRPWLAQRGVPAGWLPDQAIAFSALIGLNLGTVTVEHLRITAPGLTIDADGSLAAIIRRVSHSAMVIHADLGAMAAHIPALVGASGIIDTEVGYSGRVPASPMALLAGDVSLTMQGGDLRWREVTASRVAFAAHSDHGAILVTKAEAEIAGITARFTGRAASRDTGWDGTIDTAAVSWRGIELATTVAVLVRSAPGGWTVGPLTGTLTGGSLTLTATTIAPASVALALDNIDMAVVGAAFGRSDLSGRVSMTLEANGALLRPTMHVTARGSGLRVGAQEGTLDLDMDQDGQGIHLRRCVIDLGGRIQANGTASWPALIGQDGLSAIAGVTPDLHVDFTITDLSAYAGAVLAGGSAHLTLSAADGRALTGDLALRGLRLRHADAGKPGRRITAPLPIDTDLRLHLDAAGATLSIAATLAGKSMLSGEVTSPGAINVSTMMSRPIVGRLAVDGLPIDGLIGAIPGLLQGNGRISGGLAVAGTVAVPALTGELVLTEGVFKITSEVPAITNVHGAIAVSGRRVELRDVQADLGFSTAMLRGAIELDDLGEPQLDLRLTGANLLLTQSRDLRLRADTDLSLSGPLRALAVSGTVVITNALYSRRIELIGGKSRGPQEDQLQLFALRDPPLSDLRFDVQVGTSSKHGNEGLRISNNLVRATATVGLHLGGTGALPQPEGSVVVREATVTLPFSTMIVEHAEVVFPPGDPFAPTITAVAHSQVRQHSVTVEVQGTVRNPEIHAASAGVEERDALLLLSTGATTAELEDPDGQRAALSRVGTWLGRETLRLVQGPGNPDAGPTPLDRLTIEIGRAVSDSGRDTIETELRFNDEKDALGYYLYGERDRYDDYNMGFIVRWRFGAAP